MNFSKLEKVRYPIIYMSIGFIISSIFFTYYDYNFGLVALFTSLFFIVVTCREGREFLLIIVLIFLIGLIVNKSFYEYTPKLENVRIIKNYGNYAIGEEKGREFEIYGELSKIIEGSKVSLKGDFKRKINKERGRIGSVNSREYKIIEKSIFTKLANLKNDYKNILKENIGVKNSSLVSSILFGRDENLDKYDEKDMRELGIIHAISVSGLHIGLIFILIQRVSNKKISLIFTFLYVVLSGLSFSSLRAFIGIFFLQISFFFKRTPMPLSGLFVSMIILFFWKPYFIFSVGFQLSYGATIGIILFNRKIEDLLYKVKNPYRSVISLSLSAQILTFPLLVIYFNTASISFILGNLIIVPIINVILVLGLIGFATYKISFIFGFIVFLLEYIVDFFFSLLRGIDSLGFREVYLGEQVGYFYIFTGGCFYMYKKGLNYIKYAPIIYMGFLFILNYSIFPTIEYRREGAIVISYKGEKAIMTNSKNIDLKEVKKKTDSKFINEEIIIGENIKIESFGKDYLLNVDDKKYLLKMTKEELDFLDYDIINFKEGRGKKLKLIDDKVLIIE
ncbi:MAG: ComEC/Rec2 family competence protein [Clostridium sp.]|uniref:ComEC/Rec2 family competence protein n=1 Tax=Clostridium sp. TaxID=1506 RepID=UPI003F377D71